MRKEYRDSDCLCPKVGYCLEEASHRGVAVRVAGESVADNSECRCARCYRDNDWTLG